MSTTIDDKVVAGASSSSDLKKDPIIALTEQVRLLYDYRDHYFDNYPISNAINKSSDLEKEMKKTISKFDECKGYEIEGQRANYYYLKGRALNVVDRFVPQAEELLSKAVKLEPKLIDAWNELGECYWKNDDIEQAKNCFVGALPHGRNKTSLRNLSMVLRQELVNTHKQKIDNVMQGVEYAKEAVSMDTTDGTSWTILGNAYLSSFFTVARNPATLKLCMCAYAQAEKDVVAKNKPDLYFSKATVFKYQEEYQLALEALDRAMLLDPTWQSPRNKFEDLLKYLKDMQKSIHCKGRLKPKRLHQMVQALDEKHIGSYKNTSFEKNKEVQLQLVELRSLTIGSNVGKVVFGKVICWIQNADSVPFAFCLVDKEKTTLAVTVYNLAEGRGLILGDTVAIPEPFLSYNKFSYCGNDIDFKSIRVETPVVLVVNGRNLGKEQQASANLSSYRKTD
ncbi:tetratricopeptide repeat protein 5-like isoform X2 [Aphidius gifuensis]|nr:tetratricopeptide repeat protein 5-like isoform X2 [Aphidius gifuensis]XP_044003758.1 tetratricopeptide repeat protein 5-like isoform X2 [Aphidius gifuensis]